MPGSILTARSCSIVEVYAFRFSSADWPADAAVRSRSLARRVRRRHTGSSALPGFSQNHVTASDDDGVGGALLGRPRLVLA